MSAARKFTTVKAGLPGLVERMTPLADWLKQFKPTCNTITITAADKKMILKSEDQGRSCGFDVNGGLIVWRGFELKVMP